MSLKKKFSAAWFAWISAFIAIEGAALMDPGPGDTLSEHIWAFLEGGPARYILFVGWLVWFTIHTLWKGSKG